jgi:hypothetical protein
MIGNIALSAGVGAFGSTNPSKWAAFKELIKKQMPDITRTMAATGISSIGAMMGCDWRITALISTPIRAGLGVGLDSLFNANSINSTSIMAAIKNGMAAGAKSIGFDFGGSGGAGGLFGTLSSKSVAGAIESAVGQNGLFSNILGVVKDALLSPVNLASSMVNAALDGVKGFTSLIQEKGLGGAFESLATSIFSRQTIERLFSSGGVGGVVSTAAKVFTSLNGQSVQEQNLGGGTSLFYDLAGTFIGKKENGVTQLGTFGQTTLGKWGLLAGNVIANLAGGLVFAGEVQNGQLYGGNITDATGTKIFEFKPEGGTGPIVIDGSQTDSGSGSSFWDVIIKYLPFVTDFIFKDGELKSADVDITPVTSQNSTTVTSTKPFFLLANGINNGGTKDQAGALMDPVAPYYTQLKSDLVQASAGQVTNDDVKIPVIYPNILRSFLSGLNTVGNRTLDVFQVIAEGQTPQWHFPVVQSIQQGIDNFYAERKEAGEDATNRPVVGVGYSGGMAPLLEALASKNVPTAAIVGAGAAIADITEIRESLENIINALEYVQTNVFSPVKGILGFVFGNTLGRLPYIGNGIQNTVEEFLAGIDAIVSMAGTPTAVITDLLGKYIEEAVGRSLEALKIQGKLRDLDWLGLANINTPGAVMVNVYGDNDVLNRLNVGGYRNQIANFSTTGQSLINVEVISYTNTSGKIATADHYIYFGNTRDYSEIQDVGERAAQMDFDAKVNNFMTLLILASEDPTTLQSFIDQQVSNRKLKFLNGKYEYYPNGY